MSSCYRHASKEAVGACINCGELVCAACHKEIEGRSYCQACVEKLFAAKLITPAENVTTAAKPITPAEDIAPAAPAVSRPPVPTKKEKAEAATVLHSAKSVESKAPEEKPAAYAAKTEKSGISWVWWIPPVVLGWIGGLISWLPNKDSEPKTARNMLITGIGMSALQGLLSIILIIALIVPVDTKPVSPSTVSLKPAEPTDTSSVQPSVQPAVVNRGQPSDESSVTVETPQPEEEAAARPTVLPKLTPLVTKRLEPSAESQTVSYGDNISVTIPGGGLKEAQNLTISSISDLPPLSSDKRFVLAAYDISFERQHEFEKDLSIEFTYDPAKLQADISPRFVLSVAYLEKDGKTWTEMPFSVDSRHNKVTVNTSHNGPWVLSAQGSRMFLETDHFLIVFNRDDFDFEHEYKIRQRTDIPSAQREALIKELAVRYEMNCDIYTARHVIPGPNNKPVTDLEFYHNDASHPPEVKALRPYILHPYIYDAAESLEQAYKAYEVFKNKEGNPKLSGNKIIVNVEAGGTSSSILDKIHLTYDRYTADILARTVSHELFHVLQGRDYYVKTLSVFGWGNRTWWIDSTAEYAAGRIAQGKKGTFTDFNLTHKYFDLPLTFVSAIYKDAVAGWLTGYDPDHEYRNAYFWDYLVKWRAVDFVCMYNYVASYSSPMEGLNSFITKFVKDGKGDSVTTAETYRDFAEQSLFNGDVSDMSRGSQCLDYEYFLDSDLEKTKSFILPGGLSARYYGVLNSSKKTRNLKVELLPEPPDDYVRIDVYLLKGNLRAYDSNFNIPAGWPAEHPWQLLHSWDGYLQHTSHAAATTVPAEAWQKGTYSVDLENGDGLYILATNNSWNIDYQVGVRIFEEMGKVQINAVPKIGITGAESSFEAVPLDFKAEGAQFLWHFGDGQSGAGQTTTHVYGDAKSYQVHVFVLKDGVTLGTGTLTYEVENKGVVTIQPANSSGWCFTNYTFTAQPINIPADDIKYAWKVDGDEVNKSSLTKRFWEPGKKDIKVTATWGDGQFADSATTFTVALQTVSIVIAPDVIKGEPGKLYTFTAKPSDGVPKDARYRWDFGDGNTDNGQKVTHSYEKLKKYNITVVASWTLSDSPVAPEITGERNFEIYVDPTVKIISPSLSGNINDPCTFFAESSPMPEGAKIEWYIEGGTKYRDTDTVKHIFTTPGRKTIIVQWVMGKEVVPICKDQIQFTVGGATQPSSSNEFGWYLINTEAFSKLGGGKCSDGSCSVTNNGKTYQYTWTKMPKYLKPGSTLEIAYTAGQTISVRYNGDFENPNPSLVNRTGSGKGYFNVPSKAIENPYLPPSNKLEILVGCENEDEAGIVKYTYELK